MRVLVAIDDSECSAEAFDTVLKRRWAPDTQVKLLNVLEPLHWQYPMEESFTAALIEYHEELKLNAHAFIKRQMERLNPTLGKDNVSGCVMEGAAGESILAFAKDWQADLIVLGSHGRNGLQKMILGSVADKVSRHATCSVEIVKGKAKHKQESAA